MKHFVKQATAVLMVGLTIMIAGSGCRLYTDQDAQANAIKYLEDKYGDQGFTVKDVLKNEEKYNMYISSTTHPDWELYAKWDYKKTYTDNYAAWMLQSEVEQVYQPVFDEVYGECKAFNKPAMYEQSNLFDQNTTIDEYMATAPSSNFQIFVGTDPSRRDADVKSLLQAIKAKNWHIDILIVYLPKEELGNVTRDNYEDIFEAGSYICNGMDMYYGADIDLDNIDIQWEEGNLK